MKYRELEGYKYQLLETETVNTGILGVEARIVDNHTGQLLVSLWDTSEIFVFLGYCWDGASGPTVDDETNMLGALIHDALYQLMREGKLSRKYRKRADELLRDTCIADGIKYLKPSWRIVRPLVRALRIAHIKARYNLWYLAVRLRGKKRSLPSKKPRGKIVEI